jgi:outer membrane protein TolC
VELDAAAAFFMLYERRGMLRVTREQLTLARQLVSAASARHASGQAGASDVLRAEVEVARLQALARSRAEEVQGAEAMLNASIGRPADTVVPRLEGPAGDRMPPPWAEVREGALRSRPELMAGAAEIRRAESEVEVMRSMYWPMGMIRVGSASTMAEGPGAMLMVGVSLPIWRQRLRAGVSEARAMQDMARADLEAMRRMVEGQAAQSLSQVRAAREQLLGLRDDVVPRAQRTIEPTLAEYSSGRGSLLSVIEAAQALWMAQADLVMAETGLALAWVRLQRATGSAGGETR